jgi:dTDP-glucose 4,6-dehydratase
MCATYGEVYSFDAIIARLFAFVGPLLPLNSNYAIGNFIRDVLRGGPVRITGDGTPYRSYLYAADLAIWLWTLLLRGRSVHPYNVGSPHALTITDLAKAVVRVAGAGSVIETAGAPVPGLPVLRYVPETTRAEKELGLRVHVSLDDGIRRTSSWYRSYH